MSRVAIITDSACDLPAPMVAALGIRIIPLYVRFGDEELRAGVDLTTEEFWTRVVAPGAPFPATAAASPGDFKAAFEEELAGGADGIVCITMSSRLSATFVAAELGAQALPGAEIHVVDSRSATMGLGILATLAAEMAADGLPAAEIAAGVRDRTEDICIFAALDTLEFLRKGGRLSFARAAIGTILSVKPIITVRDGLVEVIENPRTRVKARARVIELLSARPAQRVAIVHTPDPGVAEFREQVLAGIPGGVDPEHVATALIGASVGPHLGPGTVGAVLLLGR